MDTPNPKDAIFRAVYIAFLEAQSKWGHPQIVLSSCGAAFLLQVGTKEVDSGEVARVMADLMRTGVVEFNGYLLSVKEEGIKLDLVQGWTPNPAHRN